LTGGEEVDEEAAIDDETSAVSSDPSRSKFRVVRRHKSLSPRFTGEVKGPDRPARGLLKGKRWRHQGATVHTVRVRYFLPYTLTV